MQEKHGKKVLPPPDLPPGSLFVYQGGWVRHKTNKGMRNFSRKQTGRRAGDQEDSPQESPTPTSNFNA